MELWSMAAKGFPAIFSTENSDSASFSYELLYKEMSHLMTMMSIYR